MALKRAIGVIFTTLLVCGVVHAQEIPPTPSIFSFSGFGTLGVAHSSEHHADFVASDLQGKGAGASNTWSPYVDSRIGVQLTAHITPDWTGVVQVVSEQRYDGDFTPKIEWANVKYNLTPDFSIRVGRVVLPSFLLSDTRKVGYATPWVRTPAEVYNLVPITNSDGIDFSYRHQFGPVKNTTQFIVGEGKDRAPNGDKDSTHITGKDGWGVFNTLEYGKTMFRLSYFRTRLTIDATQELERQASAYSSQGVALVDKYGQTDKPFDFFGIGASYEGDNWFLMGEYGRINPHSGYGEREGGYVSSGYRVGKFTPYVTYAFADVRSNTSDPGLNLTGFPPVDAQITVMNGQLNNMLGSAPVQKTYSMGMRWDGYKDIAVKFQLDHSRMGSGSYGMLNNRETGYTRGGHYNLFSATIDFLF